ncbi:MAG TPA: PIG-L family deacetylase, partial [Trebonia sp.]|nr:PIG-L family deacetylase [Trebonia sp.]
MSRPVAGPHPIDAPGTDEDTWAAWQRLDALPNARSTALFGVTSAVVVAAHPDDEVLGAGGLISVLAAAGARLRLVAVTDGEASHRGRADQGDLVTRRCNERAAALRELGA